MASKGQKCIHIDCPKTASFGCVVQGKRLYCKNHKLEDMVNLTAHICREVDCDKIASFNYRGETAKLYCSKHKKELMVRVYYNRCRYVHEDGIRCSTTANYCSEEDTKAKYCSKHKLHGMVLRNKSVPICIEENCTTIASFNYTGQRKRLYCKQHKLEGMISLGIQKKCRVPDCTNIPLYGHDGQTEEYCCRHKLEGMIYLRATKSVKCKYRPLMHIFSLPMACNKVAAYNYPGQNSKLYCESHKLEGMVQISTAAVCIEVDCKVTPSFNYPGQNKRLYCAKHRLDGMVDLTSYPLTCKADGCISMAEYNMSSYKRPKFCVQHKTEDMVLIKYERKRSKVRGINSKKRKRDQISCSRSTS